MDAGSAIIAGIAALGGGASAIIAWAARADSLVAAKRAEAAEEAALEAWRDSAAALTEANKLQVRQYDERLARERKLRRVEVAEHFRRWYTEDAFRRALGTPTTSENRAEKRDLSIRMSASGEPGAHALATEIIEAVKKVEKGSVQGAMEASATIGSLTFSWINNPEKFMEDRRENMTVDRLAGRLQEVVDGVQSAASSMKKSSAKRRVPDGDASPDVEENESR